MADLTTLTKPFQPAIQSTLEEVINKLPDDFTMKGQAVPNHLKKVTPKLLRGKGLKQEEIDASGVFAGLDTVQDKITKKDLLERIANRADVHRTTTLGAGQTKFDDVTLSVFKTPTYVEQVRRYSNNKDRGSRQVRSHYNPVGIDDEMYATRKAINSITDPVTGTTLRGQVIMEIQSDLHQTGRQLGYSLEESFNKLDEVRTAERDVRAEEARIEHRLDELSDADIDDFPEDGEAEMDVLREQLFEIREARQVAGTKSLKLQDNILTAENRFQRFMGSVPFGDDLFDAKDRINAAKANFTSAADNLRELGVPEAKIIEFRRKAKEIEKKFPMKLADELKFIDEFDRVINLDQIKSPIVGRNREFSKLITETFRDPEVYKHFNRSFGFSDENTPFKKNWVDKAIEEELVEAEMNDLEFIAIPLEVGGNELVRGEGVQKWYETTVRSKLQAKAEEINNKLRKLNPDITEDELFKYKEVTLKSGWEPSFTEDTKFNDITSTLETFSTDDLLEIGLDFDLIDESEVTATINTFMASGRFTNRRVARDFAVRELLQEPMDNVSAKDLNEMFGATFDNAVAHTVGMIELPKIKTIARTTPRGGNSTVEFSPEDLRTYIDLTPTQELIDLAATSKFIDVTKLKLSEDNASIKQHIFESLQTIPSKPEIERLAKLSGIPVRVKQETQADLNIPTWIQELSLYSAAPIAGMRVEEGGIVNFEKDNRVPIPAITKALRSGATREQVTDYLVNGQGHDRDSVESAIDEIYRGQVKAALDAGHSPNQVVEELLARGFKPEDIDRYLPNKSLLEDVYDFTFSNLEMTRAMGERALAVLFGIPTTADRSDAAKIAAQVVAAEETVDAMVDNFMAPFSRTMAIKAQSQVDHINTSIIRELDQIGLQAQRGENGAILIPDSNGVFTPLNVSTLDIMLQRKDEVFLALAGATAAMRRAPKHPLVQFAAGTVGGAIGAGVGRGSDILRNKLWLKEEIESKLLVDEMIKAGAADAVFSSLGTLGIQASAATMKGIAAVWDTVARGNQQGANRALLEFLHITEEQADEIVAGWEKLNKTELPGNKIRKRFSVLPRIVPDASILTGPASKQSSKMSVNASREINKRAKDLNTQANKITNERISAILANELPEYKRKVLNTYESTKEIAINSLKNSNYNFDYEKLVIEPTLDEAVQGIENPQIRKQANRLFKQIQAIGGKEFETPDGLVVTNNRRTFRELLELRELVSDFGDKRSITKPKDIELVNKMLNNIDREIKKAVRLNMEGAEDWLKAWDPAKQGLKNMKSVEQNVLFKAIVKTGATNQAVLNAMVKRADSLDGTYREILQALPGRLRAPTEAAVIQGLVERWTIGDPAGRQAIDFVALDKALKHIPFSTKTNRDMKQAIGEMARVYKNDPHILASTGTVKLDAFQSYLTDDPIIRLKYMFVSGVFNHVKRLAPTDSGRKAAMILATAKALEKPADSIAVEKLINFLPPDPELRNSLKRQLIEIAKANEVSNFPQVPVYSVQPKGHASRVIKGELGTGKYYFSDKTKARTKSRISGGKLEEKLVLPDRVADEFMIAEVLGLPEGTEVTSEMVKNHPRLKDLLESRGFSGLMVKDTILLF